MATLAEVLPTVSLKMGSPCGPYDIPKGSLWGGVDGNGSGGAAGGVTLHPAEQVKGGGAGGSRSPLCMGSPARALCPSSGVSAFVLFTSLLLFTTIYLFPSCV